MIPKKIHYCWFGNGKMSKDNIASIKSWEKTMPDYELVLWNEANFDVDSVRFTKEAYSVKKWAFVADYVRLYAVYNYGGIYFDTDVYALKSFDQLLKYDYFTSLEFEGSTRIYENVINSDLDDIQRIADITFQSGLFGGISGHPFLKDCLEWYNNRRFILENGTYLTNQIASCIYPAIAQKYGFRYIYQPQKISCNMMILPSSLFAQGHFNLTDEMYAVHWWEGSWRWEKEISSWIQMLKRNNTIRKLFGKEPILSIEEKIKKSLVADQTMTHPSCLSNNPPSPGMTANTSKAISMKESLL